MTTADKQARSLLNWKQNRRLKLPRFELMVHKHCLSEEAGYLACSREDKDTITITLAFTAVYQNLISLTAKK